MQVKKCIYITALSYDEEEKYKILNILFGKLRILQEQVQMDLSIFMYRIMNFDVAFPSQQKVNPDW